jgi:hypothetical protein
VCAEYCCGWSLGPNVPFGQGPSACHADRPWHRS